MKNLRYLFFVTLIVLLFQISCENKSAQNQKELKSQKKQVPEIKTDKDTFQVKAKTDPEKKLIKDFIPKGWEIILQERGDLNGDGLPDEAVIIQDQKKENYIVNENMGVDILNINPRTLLIFFKTKNGGYELIAKNDRGFIEPENSEINSCLSDPLLQDGNLIIKKDLLKISFNYWLSCGSYYVNNESYTFRFQSNRFALIGYDHTDYNRASGEKNSTSVNFLTGKKSTTSGGNMFEEDDEQNTKTTWTKISKRDLYGLENMSEDINLFN